MARDQVEIWREDFAVLDECFPKGKAAARPHQCQYQYYPQEPKTHQVIPIPSVTHKVIKYHEAPRAGDRREAPRTVDCYEAAHLYGGTLLVDCSKRNQHRVAYWSA